MGAASTTAIITGAIADFGPEAVTILTAVIGVGIALLVFRWGWKKVRGSVR